ncbi:MAG: hypothetical protein ACREL5_00170 [Gemmatimonadales bacterium]
MRRLLFAVVPLIITGQIAAQTEDAARLSMGISIGRLSGSALWSVTRQPIVSASPTIAPDTIALRRNLGPNLTVSGHLTYFPKAHLGWTLEFTHLGLGPHDRCEMIRDNGDPALVAACDSLASTNVSAAASVVHGGAIYRPIVNSVLQPFVVGTVGLAFTPSSTVFMASQYGEAPGRIVGTAPLRITIYNDNGWREMRPSWSAGAGFVSAPRWGYSIRFEARETWLSVSQVTGATSGQGYAPPIRSGVRGFFSAMIGFDIAFRRVHGRRY